MRLTIGQGTRRDYQALAPWHYRAAAPAVVDRVLTARYRGELVGVLVVARGVLNAPWRAVAWPGVFDHRCPSRRARAVNARPGGVRCLARVIIDPRARGLGVATRLVRAYLRRPITRHTEALAAIGHDCPFFVRAGMTALPHAQPSARTRRLAAELRTLRIDPVRLTCLPALRRALDAPRRRALARALRCWSRGSRSTGRLAHGPLDRIAGAAAAALLHPPALFVHTFAGPIAKEKPCPSRRAAALPAPPAPPSPAPRRPSQSRPTRRGRRKRPMNCTSGSGVRWASRSRGGR